MLIVWKKLPVVCTLAAGIVTTCLVYSGCEHSNEIALTGIAVQEQQKPGPVPEDTLPEEFDLEAIPVGLEFLPDVPEDNPLTPEKVRLGRRCFLIRRFRWTERLPVQPAISPSIILLHRNR